MELRENLKFSQRFEYGTYQFLDHFLTRKVAYSLTGSMRRRLYKRIRKTLVEKGEGRVLPIERRKDLSMDELKNHYIKKGIPVVIEGGAKDWDCVKKMVPRIL